MFVFSQEMKFHDPNMHDTQTTELSFLTNSSVCCYKLLFLQSCASFLFVIEQLVMCFTAFPTTATFVITDLLPNAIFIS